MFTFFLICFLFLFGVISGSLGSLTLHKVRSIRKIHVPMEKMCLCSHSRNYHSNNGKNMCWRHFCNCQNFTPEVDPETIQIARNEIDIDSMLENKMRQLIEKNTIILHDPIDVGITHVLKDYGP